MLCKKLPTVCDKVRFGDRIQVRGHDILQTPYPEKSQNNVLASSKCKFSQVEALKCMSGQLGSTELLCTCNVWAFSL